MISSGGHTTSLVLIKLRLACHRRDIAPAGFNEISRERNFERRLDCLDLVV